MLERIASAARRRTVDVAAAIATRLAGTAWPPGIRAKLLELERRIIELEAGAAHREDLDALRARIAELYADLPAREELER